MNNITEALAYLKQRRAQAESAINSNRSKVVAIKQTLSQQSAVMQSLNNEKASLRSQMDSLLAIMRK